MPLAIVRADYHEPRHATDLVNLLDAYARDPMGGNHPLAPEARGIAKRLAARANSVGSMLAMIWGETVGPGFIPGEEKQVCPFFGEIEDTFYFILLNGFEQDA